MSNALSEKPLSMRDTRFLAENTKQKIMSRSEVREAFQKLLDEYLPPEKIVRRIVEGLDAVQTKLFFREGDVIETVVLPDHRVRLLFVVLALKLKGWDPPPAEVNEPTEIVLRWASEQPEWSPKELSTD